MFFAVPRVGIWPLRAGVPHAQLAADAFVATGEARRDLRRRPRWPSRSSPAQRGVSIAGGRFAPRAVVLRRRCSR
eukprot:1247613-Alexandrium_andersonii.AAC.1